MVLLVCYLETWCVLETWCLDFYMLLIMLLPVNIPLTNLYLLDQNGLLSCLISLL